MSIKLGAFLATHARSRGTAKALLLEIAHFADDCGKNAYPSTATLAQRLGRDRRTVKRQLRILRANDELEIFYNAGPNGTNLYRIPIEKISARAGIGGGDTRPNVTGDKLPHKGRSSLKGIGSYSASGSERIGSSAVVATPASSRQARPAAKARDFRAEAEKNDYMSCRDCGSWLGRCRCGLDINLSFDAAMRDTLDAGKPGPAQLASEAALRKANERSQLAVANSPAKPTPQARSSREMPSYPIRFESTC